MVSEEVLKEVITCATRAAASQTSKKNEVKVVLENEAFTVLLINSVQTLKEALAVMREGFYPNESICIGVKLGEDLKESGVQQKVGQKQVSGEQGVVELEMLTLETAKDGISLVAVEKATNQVAGAAFTKIQRSCGATGEKGFFESFRDEHCQSISAIALIDAMIEVDSRFDVFDHYGVSCALEVMFLATRPAFRKRGVGALLMRAAFDAARGRGVPLVVAMMTSLYTQRIARSLQMEQLREVQHEELSFLGEPIARRTGIHRSTVLVGKKVGGGT